MWTAPRAESVREAEKVLFVDGVEHLDDGTLDDLVLQRGNAQRSLPPVRLLDVRPPYRLRSVRSPLQPLGQVLQVLSQLLAVVLPRFAVDPCRRLSLQRIVGLLQPRPTSWTWCRSVVNRSCCCLPAACRIRSSPLRTLSRPCVRSLLCSSVFPLATPLPSAASAAGSAALFGDFPGTMGVSDFPSPSIIGLCLSASRCVLGYSRTQKMSGSPGSRAKSLRTCAGSSTAPGPPSSRDIDDGGFAFRLH